MVQLQDCKHEESYATVPHFTTVSNPLTPRLISYDKIFTQLLNLWTKSFGVTIQILQQEILIYLSHYKE